MTELEKFMEWLKENDDCVNYNYVTNKGGVLRFEMFRENWEVWEKDSSLVLGQMGINLRSGSWKSIARYLVEYSRSPAYHLSGIWGAICDLKDYLQ